MTVLQLGLVLAGSLPLGFVLGAYAMGRALAAEARRRRGADTPHDTDDATHELELVPSVCGDGHDRVVAVCRRCEIAAPLCFGPGLADATREAALGRIVRRMARPIKGAVHVLPEGEAYEMDLGAS